MATPTFAPIPAQGEVRPSMTPGIPEYGRAQKPGLLHRLPSGEHAGRGTQAPGEGYAYTIAHHECARLVFAKDSDRAGVELGVALVAAKRASLAERAPMLEDVNVALDLFGLRDGPVVEHGQTTEFSGLLHDEGVRRRFVDGITKERLFKDSNA